MRQATAAPPTPAPLHYRHPESTRRSSTRCARPRAARYPPSREMHTLDVVHVPPSLGTLGTPALEEALDSRALFGVGRDPLLAVSRPRALEGEYSMGAGVRGVLWLEWRERLEGLVFLATDVRHALLLWVPWAACHVSRGHARWGLDLVGGGLVVTRLILGLSHIVWKSCSFI